MEKDTNQNCHLIYHWTTVDAPRAPFSLVTVFVNSSCDYFAACLQVSPREK